MPEKTALRLDVRSLAELLFQDGSLGLPLPFGASAREGAKAHRKIQERGIPGYRAEAELSRVFPGELVELELSGRADGIYEAEGLVRIEEIKTSSRDPEELRPEANPAHRAQLGIYGLLACLERGLPEIGLDLVYAQRGTGAFRVFPSRSGLAELEAEYGMPIRAFVAWLDANEKRRRALREDLAALAFPYPEFRPGQREAAEGVFRALRDEKVLFLQAPTGIGKTMAVLYPALKALGRGFGSKIFYLTVKGSGSAAAIKALDALAPGLPGLRWIALTAKAKICFMLAEEERESGKDRPPCDPGTCPYARGYFDKSRRALHEVLGSRGGRYDRGRIEAIARERELCPFELSLDLSLHCDAVIADCNYAFDQGARLKRYFSAGKTDFIFLVDEAHNLVERARSMFSGRLSKRRVLEARRGCEGAEAKALGRLNSYLLAARKAMEPGPPAAMKRYPAGLDGAIAAAIDELEALIEGGSLLSPGASELYWELIRLRRVLEGYDESYRTLVSASGGDFCLDFLCIDPSGRLEETLREQRSSVFFSATLSPRDYFAKLIASGLSPEFLCLPSPFPPENCARMIKAGISTKWKDREGSVDSYAALVREAFRAVKGNQIVFSPSFAFQNALLARLLPSPALPPGWIAQRPGMSDAEKGEFVAAFEAEGVRAFAVSGGSFSESVDLPGERLVGAVVFGMGLPQVNAANEAMREYFESKWGRGYDWAYLYPGMNRVLQAAGRVIRSESDRGYVLLADDRYLGPECRRLFPEDWEPRRINGYGDFIDALPEGLAEKGPGES